MTLRLGAARSRFFGRGAELDALASCLASGPLVTVTGTAGVGKTRLAIEHAKTLRPEAVLIADLDEARSAAQVTAALREALGARGEDATALSAAAKARGTALLILDGCEGAVAHVAACAAEILARAPQITCLATSRRPLALGGERILHVEPLALPEGPHEIEAAASSALLLDRARQEIGELSIDDATAAGIVAISRHLGGLPLAIELCAPRLRVMSVADLAKELARGLRALGTARRDAPPRHGSLARALAPSWEMLSPPERSALAQASVFRGSFTVAAAEQVIDPGDGAPPCLDVLEALVSCSLIARRAARGGGGVRFRLHESVRQFASDQLGEAAEGALGRHEAHFLARAGQGNDDEEAGDLVAALDRALARPRVAGEGARLLSAALIAGAMLAQQGAITRGLSLLDGALRGQEGESPSLIAALLLRAELLAEAGRAAEARADRQRARELGRGSPPVQASLAAALALEALDEGRLDDAREAGDESLAMRRVLGDRRGEAEGLALLARIRRRQGNLAGARDLAERASMVAGSTGAARAARLALAELALTALDAGDPAAVERHHASLVASCRASGDRLAEMLAGSLGLIHVERTVALAGARASLGRAREELREAGARRAEAAALGCLGLVEEVEGMPVAARLHYEEAAAMHRDAEDAQLAGLTQAWLARLLASGDRLAEARDALEEARSGTLAGGEAGMLAVYDLCEAHLALAEERAALARGDERGAATCRRRVDRVLAATPEASPVAVRIARAMLLRAIPAPATAAPVSIPAVRPSADPGALVVSATARWFRPPGGERVVLDTRRALRLILRRLADAREASPGEALDIPQMLEAGWPGDRVLYEAGLSRVYAAVSHLRREGLRDVLLRRDDGYLLDPAVPLSREPD